MTSPQRAVSLTVRLSRLGLDDVSRAERLLGDGAVVDVLGTVDGASSHLDLLGSAADPDLAILALVRLCEAVRGDAGAEQLLRSVLAEEGGAQRLAAVAGASEALGDDLARRPAELLPVLFDDTPGTLADEAEVRGELLLAVGADPEAEVPVARRTGAEGIDAMRRAYRTRLLRIAATDLTAPSAVEVLPEVARALADLAGAALEAALAIARSDQPDDGRGARLAVLGMGKTGGRELNYVSDVDVIYVVEPVDGAAEDEALAVGARLAASLAHACAGASGEPPLWPVDAALRPEGKQGPLVRTLASHVSYYERWAKTWEFQALLKARPVAGDRALGEAYVAAMQPMVWAAVAREHFVEDSQAMRRRVEEHVPVAETDRQIKLGKGGLRDVEFTVQLLQLVHGRGDDTLHSPNTLLALAALSDGGYVGRGDADKLARCYRFLRTLEHRIQLYRMQRTHLMPTAERDLRRLARSAGLRTEGLDGLLSRWRTTKREVRSLHEELFYRPLLPATARLSEAEATLAPEAARARLAAMGYRDPVGAMHHIAALTEGISRRAAIQRQLLPVMLGWFGDGADPDRGLLAFRTLSEALGSEHWYLKLLRDSGSAAFRLATVLANSQFMTDALARSPKSISWFGKDEDLVPLSRERLRGEIDAILTRAQEEEPATRSLRAVRRRELSRTAAAELLGTCDARHARRSVSDVTAATLAGALRIAGAVTDAALDGRPVPARLSVVAMGRLGGRETGYGSDADVMFVYEPTPGADGEAATGYALSLATKMRALLGSTMSEPPLEVDADLRPEGRSGPLVRSIESYAEYYGRWSSSWESQALLRARPVAGDTGLGERFVALIDPLRYPAAGLPDNEVREVRRIKARVESERLPRGVEPARHLKLGPGSISDVEWTVQLLQLQHAHEVPGLRTTETLAALEAAVGAGLVEGDDAMILSEAWLLSSALRNATVLWTGRSGPTSDVLPHDRRDLTGIAQAARFPGTGGELLDHYQRTTRRCRVVMERIFYGA